MRVACAFAAIIALAVLTAGCRHAVTTAAATPPAPAPKPPAATATLSVVPDSIQRGESAQLKWETRNASTVTIDGIGTVAASGSKSIAPDKSSTYHLLAKGEGGDADASARITVNVPVAKQPGPTDEQLFAQQVKDIFFSYDKADVRQDEQSALSADLKFLVQHPTVNIMLEGHCDERGSEEYNMALGDNRASTVKQALINGGVAPSRIRTISYGKEKPFCSGDNEACWQQNRRAHFVFQAGQHTGGE